MIAFSLSLAFGCRQNNNEADIVIVGNGIEIPIDGCVEGNTKIFGNSVDPVSFCKCLIPKLYDKYKDDPEKFKLFKEGEFDKAAEGDAEAVGIIYNECMSQSVNDSTARLTITPRMEVTIREGIKNSFAGTDFEKTNDIDAYCDCLIKGMQTELTAKEIMQGNGADSIKFDNLRAKCAQATRKKN